MNASSSQIDPRHGLPSASALERYFACNGSYLLSKQVKPEEIPESADATAGQRMHAAREAGDVSELALDEADLVAQMAQEEEAIYHRWCDDYEIKDAEIVQERRVWLTEGQRRLCSAQIDFYALSRVKRMALILDRKSGRKGVQPPTRNWQLKGALVILASNFSLVGGRVAIVQPFAKRQNPCDYGPDDIWSTTGALAQLLKLLRDVADPHALRVTGPHCEYCPAKHICPEAQALVKEMMALKGMSWSALPPDIKLKLWEDGKIAIDIIEQINGAIKRDVQRGTIPGLTLTKETHPRQINSASQLYMELAQRFADPNNPNKFNEKFDGMTKVSIGAVEAFIRDWLLTSKEDAKNWVSRELGKLITTTTREGHVTKEKAP